MQIFLPKEKRFARLACSLTNLFPVALLCHSNGGLHTTIRANLYIVYHIIVIKYDYHDIFLIYKILRYLTQHLIFHLLKTYAIKKAPANTFIVLTDVFLDYLDHLRAITAPTDNANSVAYTSLCRLSTVCLYSIAFICPFNVCNDSLDSFRAF